jgi:hypothetical protein
MLMAAPRRNFSAREKVRDGGASAVDMKCGGQNRLSQKKELKSKSS